MNASRSISNSIDPRFREIPRERVSDRVANELLKLIGNGRLTPGERLPGERQLATMMGVSRVSIRAALQQLKEQGLLSAVQGGGTRLLASGREVDPDADQPLQMDAETAHDFIAIRTILEVWAARHAAERATPQQIADLEAAQQGLAWPGDEPQNKAQDGFRFQRALARASGSRMYLHLVERMRDLLEASLDYQHIESLISAEERRAVATQHAAIVAAIRDRDPAATAAAAQTHLEFLQDRHRDDAAAASSQAAE